MAGSADSMQEKLTENFIAAADRLIAAHDGDAALLYIYMLRRGSGDMEQAARELCRTLRELQDAEEKLRRMGLLPLSRAPVGVQAPAPAPAPAESLPQYRAEDVARRSKEDGRFAVILDEAAKVIGRTLSGADMKLLFGIYDYLALPPEVIMELLNYCAELYEEKYGSSRRPSPRAIEKEAYVWANREIMTLEQAEEYISGQKQRRSSLSSLARSLGIKGREPSATELKYLASWLEMGFGQEAVAIAYDRTLTNTGALKWPYMDRILTRWHENGLHSPRDIEEKDSRRSPTAPKAPPPPRQSIDLEKLRQAAKKISE